MIQPVFKISSADHTENSIVVLLEVDADSDIFSGHFPGQPVVPGACMLQTVKETLEDVFKVSLRMVKADNIKFLNIVTPDAVDLILKISYTSIDGELKIAADLSSGEQLFMKLQAVFSGLV
ncbi:hypothetical protein ACFQZS_06310 [Mucilaginibacter calamicampi]|uniref:ApeI dehydratase-like domain-containing protein n=1 Tax=Mucilaginibacter calamicampi TaxID=1302352 RepID=A0ABW2YZ56_9SPHI